MRTEMKNKKERKEHKEKKSGENIDRKKAGKGRKSTTPGIYGKGRRKPQEDLRTAKPGNKKEKNGKNGKGLVREGRIVPGGAVFRDSGNITEVKGLRIGEGMPKICVPIVGKTVDEILNQAGRILYSPADLVEWRVDHFRRCHDTKAVLAALRKLSERLEGRPVLFTFRTAREGGERSISKKDYIALYEAVIASGYADLADIEYRLGSDVTGRLISLARSRGVAVVLSYHDFSKTPPEDEIVKRLNTMKHLGADIAKIAVMPRNPRDVLALLSATERMKREENPIPVITVSMSAMGLISRISGEIFGSAVTFASVGDVSAPGQIQADEADRFLLTIHRGSDGKRIQGKPRAGRKNVILIGFMGTGKSTVARKIAKKTGMKVKEMDEMIERQEGMPIKEIFERYGEAYFRDAETYQAKLISESSGVIVSCGGGTVMRKQNVDYLKKNGTIILLEASPDTVFERVKRGGDKRPLLNDHMARGFVSYLMKKRSEAYHSAADVVIHTDGMGSGRVADEIIRLMDL